MTGEIVIAALGDADRTNAGQDPRQDRKQESVGMQPDPADDIEHYNAVEAFRPDDLDMATHDERRCNLPVDVCPACSAAEHN
ncbi:MULTISPECIES: hypothetical protein [unclassified Crossiella]|uniref:hypothetical protein n=1 Tax=unclassified Crossiella TaxID=2620835 RepID=UPI001FFEA230|nr:MULTISPECIES: hypothetical protein [unclassified Crossiella]MCK2240003.1 hypothetical protein [Crossiella sp. S99.2]MCK2252711.1 hypothetical protein [Crossiella sp. S99.1]